MTDPAEKPSDLLPSLASALRSLGFDRTEVDPRGYRMGSVGNPVCARRRFA